MKLPFRKEKELYSSLFNVIGFYPHDISLYKQALLHKSIAKRNEKGRPVNNERLEFLGDAILDADTSKASAKDSLPTPEARLCSEKLSTNWHRRLASASS